jgi:uncharacterized protein (TIGR02646 family)
MKAITKSVAPESLLSFKNKPHNNWSDIHEPKNRHVYEDCLRTCIDDQNGLCAYTEILLNEGLRHIDHYIKRDIDNSLTFEWTNMFAAVKDSRFGADWKDCHITVKDYNPDRKRYNNILNPIMDKMEGRFVYSADGFMQPANDKDELAASTIVMFNLNEASLKSRRKSIIKSVRDLMVSGLSKEDVSMYMKSSGFNSVVEYELSFW